MPHVYDLRARVCQWCGATGDDTRVVECPSCGKDSCFECMRLVGDSCIHLSPALRQVVTSQDWGVVESEHG